MRYSSSIACFYGGVEVLSGMFVLLWGNGTDTAGEIAEKGFIYLT